MRRIREQLTYANVMVTVLAVAALSGGTAYAVTKIDANSVTSKTIVDGAVRPVDLHQPTMLFNKKFTITSSGAASGTLSFGRLGDYKARVLCDGLSNAAFLQVAVASGRTGSAGLGGATQVHSGLSPVSYAAPIGGSTAFRTIVSVPFNDTQNFEPPDATADFQVILTGGNSGTAVLLVHVGTHVGNSSGTCHAAGSLTGRA